MSLFEVESDSLKFENLIELAHKFSEDGIVNLNFLQILLVNIVKILKNYDESRNFKTSHDVANLGDCVNVCDKAKRIVIESMHDSLSKVVNHDQKLENNEFSKSSTFQSGVGMNQEAGDSILQNNYHNEENQTINQINIIEENYELLENIKISSLKASEKVHELENNLNSINYKFLIYDRKMKEIDEILNKNFVEFKEIKNALGKMKIDESQKSHVDSAISAQNIAGINSHRVPSLSSFVSPVQLDQQVGSFNEKIGMCLIKIENMFEKCPLKSDFENFLGTFHY